MRTTHLMLTSLCALALIAPTAMAEIDGTPETQIQADVIGVGGYCDDTVHTMCGHETADGTCYLYAGGPDGACIAYGDGAVGYGGYCDQAVHTMCGHETALGTCYLFIGGSDGACVAYSGFAAESTVTAGVSSAAWGAAPPPLVGIGGQCEAMVHTQCSHVTALGVCHLYVGGSSGACIVYGGQERVVDSGGECSATVHVNCWHWSSPGPCGVYVGGADGRCIVY